MVDMIDRDAVLAEIGEFQIRFNETGDSHERVAYASAEHCMLVIKAAPAVNRWISVEDALPETTDTFLAIVEANGEREYVIATFARYTGHWIDKECRVLNDVTHWMPLPEPPEKE